MHNRQDSLTSSLAQLYTIVDAIEQQLILADILAEVVKAVDTHFEDEEIGSVLVRFNKDGRELKKINQALLEVNNY